MSNLRVFSLIGCGLGLLACNDPVEGGGPATITAVIAPPAVTTPGNRLPEIELRITDHESRPIAGMPLTISGDGTVDPAEVTSDSDGRVRFTWTLPGIGISGDTEWLGPPGRFRASARSLDGELIWEATTEAKVFRASQVDATNRYACAVETGELWCWSMMPWQQIVGSLSQLGRPVRATLPAGMRVAEVRVNNAAACVRRLDDGRPWCTEVSQNPGEFIAIPNAPTLLDLIDVGSEFCGRAVDRTLWCWPTGGFGTATASQRSSLPFTELSAVAIQILTIMPEGFACGLDNDGAVWCWGNNVNGSLGDGTTTSRSNPAPVLSDERFVSLRAGPAGVCARTATGAHWCWGESVHASLTTIPALFAPPGSAGLEIQPGSDMVYGIGPNGIKTWIRGREASLQPRLNEVFRAVDIVDEMGEGCALGALREVYCSWTLLRGAIFSSLFTAEFVPVPGI
ncbi:MAG: hypothetical protein U0974_11455 [Gemmatimonadales bacterium]|nr:hypothetical protein [Gemmatimonadales bacterium]MDZ4390330.1 hypothetical protein [Gemmatimonadales bacterium]